ncbi:MAG: branched-chain amino acid transporter permease [Aristaeellaceae bacterium]
MSPMTFPQQLAVIGLCILATMSTRFLPFLVFSGKRELPAFVRYLGRALPSAIFALLVVYCLRGTDVSAHYALPEILGVGATVALHLWKRRMLLSIAGGTAVYMLLVQLVF